MRREGIPGKGHSIYKCPEAKRNSASEERKARIADVQTARKKGPPDHVRPHGLSGSVCS